MRYASMTRWALVEEPAVDVLQVGVGVGGHDVEEVRPGRGHDERVPVVRPDHADATGEDGLHHLVRRADGRRREAAAEGLREADDVRLDPEVLARAAGGDGEAGLHLVHDPDDAVTAGDLADAVEVAGLRQDDPAVHEGRLHDEAGRCATLRLEADDPALESVGVVERDGHRHRGDARRDARAVGDGRVVLAIGHVVLGEADRDHHVVVVAVVRPEDLEDRVAAGDRSGQADGVHRRLGPRVEEPPLREAEAPLELLRDDDRVLGRRGEVRAERHPVRDRLGDLRVGVALHHAPEGVVDVQVPAPVHVPHVLPVAVRQVDRPRLARLVGRRHTAGEGLLRAGEHRGRSRRPLVQPAGLLLDEP